MIGENAGGPACLKYGVTKQYILAIQVVLPTGEVVRLGGEGCRGSAGYDLLHIFVSSEGTLGVVAQAELRLRRLPQSSKTILAIYNDAVAAGESVYRVLEDGVVPGKIEYIDNWIINRIEEMMPLGLPKDADAILLFQIDGMPEEVRDETSRVVRVAKRYGARDVKVAQDQAEADAYWAARKAGFAAVYSRARTVFLEDVTVPRNRMPDLVKRCKEISVKYAIDIVTFGHAGDGNLHPAILTDVSDRAHHERALKAMNEIFETAVSLGGVLSGEHGIGLEKQRFFNEFTDPVVVNIMKGIKNLLDPNNIMNPGKIWS
jgi:glycolate oxidase